MMTTAPHDPVHEQPVPTGRAAYWRRGEPMVWLAAAALAVSLTIVAGLIVITMVNGLGYFWPADLTRATLKNGEQTLGVIRRSEVNPVRGLDRLQFHRGNRDLYGSDFVWIDRAAIAALDRPADALTIERMEYGNFFGYLEKLDTAGLNVPATGSPSARLNAALTAIQPALEQIHALQARMNTLSKTKEAARLEALKLHYRAGRGKTGADPAALAGIEAEGQRLEDEFDLLNKQTGQLMGTLNGYTATLRDADGTTKIVPLRQIVRVHQPNAMGRWDKILFYGAKLVELLAGQPREANTEGGLFPAIFGTVALVFMMSLFCIPLGVIAAVYLREYAKDGLTVRLVRIAVNNLAGVPSIVYGVFGLGFFVYGLGHAIDLWFFPERLPTPTFGTGGILWASLTLALLTVPVVIVATEEALAAIPRGIREGSLALGATKFQTLMRILLPMASPGIMTGLILAMARAAGEVAPLMIVGVVKLAPALPLDAQFPFLHLNRKFMHLGFHIYDVGFQSPNVEAAIPMVYVTTMLLVGIVILMSALAIHLRNTMQKRLAGGAF